ncbi:MAG: DNA-protecting protein DprA [Roseibacillus sp.]|nr:DNA-protecting protein DprA [Roseibacillus sp.]
MTPQESLLALNLLPGLGPVRIRRLIKRFDDPAGILSAREDRLIAVEGIGPKAARIIANWEDHVDLQGELSSIRDRGLSLLTSESPAWPRAFEHLPDAPLLLYVWGHVEERDGHALAVVGSRKATHYGRDCTRRFSFQLAHAGFTIISGLARGIDTAAHEGALAAEGRTIAVLGSGLGQLYPPENMTLAERIADGHGAVVSEFPIETRPSTKTFPQRNRIVAGWCEGLLVVECPARSGAIITANLAGEYGKQVFAIPGAIDRPSSEGCNELIRAGAILVTDGSQILEDLSQLPPEARSPAPLHDHAPLPRNHPSLSEDESAVYAQLRDDQLSMDQLIEASGLPPSTVAASLLRLEMKNLSRQLPGPYFVRSA